MHNNVTYLAINYDLPPCSHCFLFVVEVSHPRSQTIFISLKSTNGIALPYGTSRNCDVRKTGANEDADLYALAAIQSDID